MCFLVLCYPLGAYFVGFFASFWVFGVYIGFVVKIAVLGFLGFITVLFDLN